MKAPSSGVVTTHGLLTLGLDRPGIDELVSAGRLLRLRRGWYAFPSADPDVMRAVRVGGVLACCSALRHHGVWVPADPRLHLRMSEHLRGRTRMPDGMTLCFAPGRRAPRTGVDPLPQALLTAIRCLDDEGLAVVLDSILNRRLLTSLQLEQLLATAPLRVRRLLAGCDGRAESGTESMVRFRLRRLGVGVRSQVSILGVGRVDLLVGDCLVLEVDSRAHHTGADTYESDRERDRAAVRLGYTVIRLTYHQVVHDWPRIEADVLDLIRRDRHRRRPNRSETTG